MRKTVFTAVAFLLFFILSGWVCLGLDADADGAAACPIMPSVTPTPRPRPLKQLPVNVTAAATMKGEENHATQEAEEETVIPVLASEHDIELIARTIWGEAEIVKSRAEQAAVAWCVLNRVDYYGEAIESIILAPDQFAPTLTGDVPDYFVELAADVVHRWEREHAGFEDVGRTLPADYRFFVGDGWRNHFSIVWRSGVYWDWSLPDPYTTD